MGPAPNVSGSSGGSEAGSDGVEAGGATAGAEPAGEGGAGITYWMPGNGSIPVPGPGALVPEEGACVGAAGEAGSAGNGSALETLRTLTRKGTGRP